MGILSVSFVSNMKDVWPLWNISWIAIFIIRLKYARETYICLTWLLTTGIYLKVCVCLLLMTCITTERKGNTSILFIKIYIFWHWKTNRKSNHVYETVCYILWTLLMRTYGRSPLSQSCSQLQHIVRDVSIDVCAITSWYIRVKLLFILYGMFPIEDWSESVSRSAAAGWQNDLKHVKHNESFLSLLKTRI